MTSPRRITFVGPGLSGRRESLSTLLRHYAGAKSPTVTGNEDRHFVVNGVGVVAAVATKRSLFGRRGAEPTVAEELERLAASSAILFVVDSQAQRLEAGTEELRLLREDWSARALDLDKLPVVFQLNKRDLSSALEVSELKGAFETGRCAYVESIASCGQGVLEAFQMALRLMDESE